MFTAGFFLLAKWKMKLGLAFSFRSVILATHAGKFALEEIEVCRLYRGTV